MEAQYFTIFRRVDESHRRLRYRLDMIDLRTICVSGTIWHKYKLVNSSLHVCLQQYLPRVLLFRFTSRKDMIFFFEGSLVRVIPRFRDSDYPEIK